MNKKDTIKDILSLNTKAVDADLQVMKKPELDAMLKGLKVTPEQSLEKANKVAHGVTGKQYDDAIINGKNAEKAQAEMTRKLLSPVFVAKTLGMNEDAIKQAFDATRLVAEKIADIHSGNNDVKNAHMSKLRVNIDRAIKAHNDVAKEHDLPEINERIAVKAVNNTQGKAYNVSFKAKNKPKAGDSDNDIVDGTVIELAIPANVDSMAKCKAILVGLQAQLGNAKNDLFADAEGEPLTLESIADLLMMSVTD